MNEPVIHVYGLDPGKMNGIVTGTYTATTPFEVTDSLELLGGALEVGTHFSCWVTMTFSVPRRLIYEKWASHNNEFVADANWAAQPIGAVEYIAGRSNEHWALPIKRRQPGPPDEAIPNQMLQDSGYWLAGGKGHKRAILKHILQQLVDEGHTPTMKKLYRKE